MPSLIGNKPNQAPSNGDLGTLAFQDANAVNITGGVANVSSLTNTGVTTVQAGTVSAPAITTTGDTNTGIFFPAADTIAFAEGGVEAMRIDSAGSVGIGTSSPVVRATISGTDSTPPALGTAAGAALFCNTSPAYGLLIGTSTGGWSWMQSQRVSGAATAYDLVIQPSGGGVNIGDSTVSVGTGCLRLTGNIGVGGATPATSGKGITFPATQSASTDANTLDDYEEGTWTPVLSDGTNNATMDAGTAGVYTKVGRIVTINCIVQTTSLGSVSGNLRVLGLPFVAASGTANAVFSSANQFLNITSGQYVSGRILGTVSYIDLWITNSTAGMTQMTSTQWSSDGYANFSASYFV